MDIYLLDGTYELFRHHFALPSYVDAGGQEIAATRGVLASVVGMFEAGVTHLGVATDHVIESFRNDLWPGYKTSEGMDPVLLAQFPLLEECLQGLGVVVWPMVEFEADDALATGARLAAASQPVNRVLICTPDKDLAQCVEGKRVVQLERRTGKIVDVDGVVAKFGVPPASIPDYLALVGDSADGFPGLQGWGAKSAAMVLARYGHITDIPREARSWDIPARGARFDNLAVALRENLDRALLFRDLATLRKEVPISAAPESLLWPGPSAEFAATCARLESPQLLQRAQHALDMQYQRGLR